MPRIYEVFELTKAVRDTLEGEFPFVWVRGQVSNLARPASGHIYFTLKDQQAVLAVVWFKGAQPPAGGSQERVDLETGEVLTVAASDFLAEGGTVLVAGRLTVYPPQGRHQLVAELVQDEGVGEMARRFQALCATLAARGWFDPAAKKPLPENPSRVALVTSGTGAAVRDFIRLARERGLSRELRVYPTLVSGEQAAPLVAAAVTRAGRDGFAQVVVVLRGGGSVEDLGAFNTLEVAEAIHACPAPVISAVGHEVDTTIADLVADKRAATPSHAAEMLWVRREIYAQAVDELDLELFRVFGRVLEQREEALARAVRTLGLLSPAARLKRAETRLAEACARLTRAVRRVTLDQAARLDALERRLFRFAASDRIAQREERLARAEKGLMDVMARRIARDRDRLTRLGEGAPQAWDRFVFGLEARLREAVVRLLAADPEAPLRLGFSLVSLEPGGVLVRDAASLAPGQRLRIRAARGEVTAVVEGPAPDPVSKPRRS